MYSLKCIPKIEDPNTILMDSRKISQNRLDITSIQFQNSQLTHDAACFNLIKILNLEMREGRKKNKGNQCGV